MTPEDVEFLCTPAAQKLLETGAQIKDLVKRSKILRRETSADKAALISSQVDLRVKAAKKFSQAPHMLFEREGLEQASAEVVANYIGQRLPENRTVIDLTCGIGGDAIALPPTIQ